MENKLRWIYKKITVSKWLISDDKEYFQKADFLCDIYKPPGTSRPFRKPFIPNAKQGAFQDVHLIQQYWNKFRNNGEWINMRGLFWTQICNIQDRQTEPQINYFFFCWQIYNTYAVYTMYSILTILHKPSSNSDCCWTQNANVSLSYWCFLNYAGIQISMKSISSGERAVLCKHQMCKTLFWKISVTQEYDLNLTRTE